MGSPSSTAASNNNRAGVFPKNELNFEHIIIGGSETRSRSPATAIKFSPGLRFIPFDIFDVSEKPGWDENVFASTRIRDVD